MIHLATCRVLYASSVDPRGKEELNENLVKFLSTKTINGNKTASLRTAISETLGHEMCRSNNSLSVACLAFMLK